jgi:hypothetical protein
MPVTIRVARQQNKVGTIMPPTTLRWWKRSAKKVHMFDTWNDSARSALVNIFGLVISSRQDTAEPIRKGLDEFISSLYDRPGGEQRAMAHFASIGADTVQVAKNRGINLTLVQVHQTLVRKQKDYGPENIRRFGRKGLLIRLHDKVARLENLDGGGRDPENESVIDTFLDIIGYCAIGIMWERDEFLLPVV